MSQKWMRGFFMTAVLTGGLVACSQLIIERAPDDARLGYFCVPDLARFMDLITAKAKVVSANWGHVGAFNMP